MNKNSNTPGLTQILIQIVRLWGKGTLKTIWKTRRLQLGMLRARQRRRRALKKDGLRVPLAIAISPTMRCNLSCDGCYSRFHPREEEMPPDVIESVVSSASRAGVFLFVITGGEPFLRPELIDIYRKHRDVLFLTVTNGTMIDERMASDMTESGNILPIVSIEGTSEHTDERRGPNVYEKVLSSMGMLKRAGLPFGFSAVLASSSIPYLGSREFVRDMVKRGCSVGFFNEFIPMIPEETHSVPSESQRREFKGNLDRMRKEEPIILLHLPDDEYDDAGRCMAVGSGAFHINAQGYVEPCPFAHFARENVMRHSFEEILGSPFLEAIRKHPTALQRCGAGCSLAGNRLILEEIAEATGAKTTEISTAVTGESHME